MKVTHLPFDGDFKVTWQFGAKSEISGTRDGLHHGIDLVGVTNKEIYSTAVGVVEFAGFDPGGFGNYVKIVGDGNGYSHYLAHLSVVAVRPGQRVTYTTRIGTMGATGNVTGPHLHYEIRKDGNYINPTPYMGIPNKVGNYNANNYLIETNEIKYNIGRYRVNTSDGVNVRKGPGIQYDKIPLNQLSQDAKEKGGYINGTVFDVLEINENWGRTPSGWVCLDYCIKI